MSHDFDSHRSLWMDLMGVSFTQGYLDAGGVRTRYLAAGDPDKPLLILIHGTGGHLEAYSRNIAAHAEHFWTVAIDLVGHGLTAKPPLAYEIADYTRHVIDVIRALGRDKAHVSGESLGGWIATDMAVNHRDWLLSAVLNTAGGYTMFPAVMERIRTLSRQAVADPSTERLRARLEFLMHDKRHVNDDLVATRQRIYAQPGFAEVMERILCLQEEEIRRRNMFTDDDYRGITTPALVLWTRHDPTAGPEVGEKIAGLIPGARLAIMDDCGHWPQYEDAETFNRVHLDFLRGV